jgi:hypothetical protein
MVKGKEISMKVGELTVVDTEFKQTKDIFFAYVTFKDKEGRYIKKRDGLNCLWMPRLL